MIQARVSGLEPHVSYFLNFVAPLDSKLSRHAMKNKKTKKNIFKIFSL